MKVTHAEISAGTRNRRTRRTTGLTGCVITFDNQEHIDVGAVVSIQAGDKEHAFKIAEISTAEGGVLEFCAVEYGYWAEKIDNIEGFDLRKLLGLSVNIVTDKEELANLQRASCFN